MFDIIFLLVLAALAFLLAAPLLTILIMPLVLVCFALEAFLDFMVDLIEAFLDFMVDLIDFVEDFVTETVWFVQDLGYALKIMAVDAYDNLKVALSDLAFEIEYRAYNAYYTAKYAVIDAYNSVSGYVARGVRGVRNSLKGIFG